MHLRTLTPVNLHATLQFRLQRECEQGRVAYFSKNCSTLDCPRFYVKCCFFVFLIYYNGTGHYTYLHSHRLNTKQPRFTNITILKRKKKPNTPQRRDTLCTKFQFRVFWSSFYMFSVLYMVVFHRLVFCFFFVAFRYQVNAHG